MEAVLGAAVSTVLLGAIGLGLYFWGRSAEGKGTTVSVNPSNANADCDAACKQFEARRQERCNAKFAEAAAKSELDARRTDYWAAVGVWVALAAAAAAALAAPPPWGWIAACILGTLAAAASGVAIFLLGKLNAASEAWSAASAALMTANMAVITARNIVITNCPQGVNTPCLGH